MVCGKMPQLPKGQRWQVRLGWAVTGCRSSRCVAATVFGKMPKLHASGYDGLRQRAAVAKRPVTAGEATRGV